MHLRVIARILLTASVAVGVLPLTAPPASGAGPEPGAPAGPIEDRYIVVFRGSVDNPKSVSDNLESAEGFRTRLLFRYALEGFSAQLSAEQVARLRRHPKVAYVVQDREVEALGTVAINPPDAAPTGVRRIEAASTTEAHEASSVNVAVIDTGIDLAQPDLNAANGKDCTGSEPAQDDNGHGTHVAGTIAGENNGSGVVGVAPGTKVWAVKTLNANGSGSWSQIICGIDWVTGTRTDADSTNDIAVANMSLGGLGSPLQSCGATNDALHQAICNSTAAGVSYVVAAGNNGWDYDYPPQPNVPAVYPEVLTVSAVSDSDGLPGAAGGPPTCRSGELDDRYASFSNYALTAAGRAHTVAGPGVCILSDAPGGGTATMSGTSMATPHLTGVVALCLDEAGTAGPCSGMTPAQIIQRIRSDAEGYSSTNSGYGFTGDPIRPVSTRYYGYLTRVGMAPPTPPPPPPPPPTPDGTPPEVTTVSPSDGAAGVQQTTNVSVAFNEAMDHATTQSAFSLAPTAGGAAVGGSFSWSGATMTFDPSTSLAQATSYTARVGTAARDASGEALAAEHTWSFSTVTPVTIVSQAPSTVTLETGTLRSGGAAQLTSDDNAYYQVNSTTGGTRTASWYGSFPVVSNDLAGLKVTYGGKSSRSCTQTVSIWSWATSSWAQLDSRSVSSAEVLVESTPSGTLGDYVSGASGDGELRMRVRCTRSGKNFYTSGDLLRIAYNKP